MPVRKSPPKAGPPLAEKVKTKKSKVQVKSQKLEAEKPKVAVKRSDGLVVDVYDTKGKVLGKTSLPKELFAVKVNPVLMAQAVRVYLANQRKGTASTKTRGEITATTAKVWRQKGTGRARHGAKSAPIWVGGGVVFGPRPRDFSLHLPKKMRRYALASAFTSRRDAIRIVDGLEMLTPKTKIMLETIKAVTANHKQETQPSSSGQAMNKDRRAKDKILLVTPGKVESVQQAARNIAGVTVRPVNLLNTYEVLNNDTLLFMKEAINKLEVWSRQTS